MSRRIIGLTGGIATGKSTVSCYLSETYHTPVLDADLFAREAVNINSPILETIIARYGREILLLDSTLNRKKLGEIIFNNRPEKTWLEAQIHPYVRNRILSDLEKIEAQVIILVIPLLFESKMTDLVNEIWVVYCSSQEQVKRLIERDRLTPEQAIARRDSQWPIDEKIALADVILDNSSSREDLFQQIDNAFLINS
jgi:dephospho-CoA kinase